MGVNVKTYFDVTLLSLWKKVQGSGAKVLRVFYDTLYFTCEEPSALIPRSALATL